MQDVANSRLEQGNHCLHLDSECIRFEVNDLLQTHSQLQEELMISRYASECEGVVKNSDNSLLSVVRDSVDGSCEQHSTTCSCTISDNHALQLECQQLRKECACAEQWVHEARKLTEAKQGMLTLHDALHVGPVLPGVDQRRDQLCAAVRVAVEAETEAQELVDAKREQLAQCEVLLKESDRQRLEQAAKSVEGASWNDLLETSDRKGTGILMHVKFDDD